MTRYVPAADAKLSADLADRDIIQSPRQLETMRQSGLLEQGRHAGLGQGAGSRSVRPTDETDRAQYMAHLLVECGSHADAVLVAFVRDDYPIAADRLVRAYESTFGSMLRWIEKRSAPAASSRDTAASVAVKVATHLRRDKAFRPLRDQIKRLAAVQHHTPMHRAMYDFAVDLILLMIAADDDAILSTRASHSIDDLVAIAASTGTDEDAATGTAAIEDLAPNLSLQSLLRVLRSSSMDELHTARQTAKAVREFARVYGSFTEQQQGSHRAFAWLSIAAMTDRGIAYSIPGFVWIRRRHAQNLDETLVFLGAWTPFFAAANTLLSELPAELRVMVRPGGYESLTTAQRSELAAHVERLEATHPDDLFQARNPPTTGARVP